MGELDLHTFNPRETARVVEAYLEACRERDILTVRIIHGKGTGALRETVYAVLRRLPEVLSFTQADERSGSQARNVGALEKSLSRMTS